MSSEDDRWKAKTRRRLAEEVAAAELVSRYMERELRSVRVELASLKDLFRLYGATPRPGQALDTWIEEQQRKFTKVFPREGGSNVQKPVPVYTKKYLKLQRKRAAALAAKAAATGVSVNEPLRKAPPAIPPSAEAALAEFSAARKAMEMPGDLGLKRARLRRAEEQIALEMVKASFRRGPMTDPRMTLKF
jgi:hypothetical protein